MSAATDTPKESSTNNRSAKKLAFLLVKIGVWLLILGFWARFLSQNWQALREFNMTPNWPLLSLSCLVFLAGYVVIPFLWRVCLQAIANLSISNKQAFHATAYSWLGRYVPGKVWTIAIKVFLSAEDGDQIPRVSVAATVEAILFIIGGMLCFTVLLPLAPNLRIPPILLTCSLLLPIGVAIFCYPKVFLLVINSGFHHLGKKKLESAPRYSTLALLCAGFASAFLLWGVAFSTLVLSLSPISFQQFLFTTTLFVMSWVAGLVVLVAPAGIGVRDSLLAAGLEIALPGNQSIILALVIAQRIITTLAEGVCFAIAIPLKKSRGAQDLTYKQVSEGVPSS